MGYIKHIIYFSMRLQPQNMFAQHGGRQKIIITFLLQMTIWGYSRTVGLDKNRFGFFQPTRGFLSAAIGRQIWEL
jgi:hypothetical protein